jgi:hypothetical protein
VVDDLRGDHHAIRDSGCVDDSDGVVTISMVKNTGDVVVAVGGSEWWPFQLVRNTGDEGRDYWCQ